MSQAFVQPPQPQAEPKLSFCQDCQGHYWTDYAHDCPAGNPLAAAEGIFLTLCGAAVLYALFYLAGAMRFGWPLP